METNDTLFDLFLEFVTICLRDYKHVTTELATVVLHTVVVQQVNSKAIYQ